MLKKSSSYSVYPLTPNRGLTWSCQSTQDGEETKPFDAHWMDGRLSDNQEIRSQLTHWHSSANSQRQKTRPTSLRVPFRGTRTWSHGEPSPPPCLSKVRVPTRCCPHASHCSSLPPHFRAEKQSHPLSPPPLSLSHTYVFRQFILPCHKNATLTWIDSTRPPNTYH